MRKGEITQGTISTGSVRAAIPFGRATRATPVFGKKRRVSPETTPGSGHGEDAITVGAGEGASTTDEGLSPSSSRATTTTKDEASLDRLEEHASAPTGNPATGNPATGSTATQPAEATVRRSRGRKRKLQDPDSVRKRHEQTWYACHLKFKTGEEEASPEEVKARETLTLYRAAIETDHLTEEERLKKFRSRLAPEWGRMQNDVIDAMIFMGNFYPEKGDALIDEYLGHLEALLKREVDDYERRRRVGPASTPAAQSGPTSSPSSSAISTGTRVLADTTSRSNGAEERRRAYEATKRLLDHLRWVRAGDKKHFKLAMIFHGILRSPIYCHLHFLSATTSKDEAPEVERVQRANFEEFRTNFLRKRQNDLFNSPRRTTEEALVGFVVESAHDYLKHADIPWVPRKRS